MKIQLTKQELQNYFDSTKTYSEIGQEMSSEDFTVTEKMVKEMFKSTGFNLRNRKRKSDENWFEVID